MTFWPLTNSDLPTDQTFHQFHDLYTELDLHRIMSGFHGAFATGVASQQGTLTLPDTWFRPPFWDLLMLQLLRPNSSNLPCLYSTFHLEYPLVLSRFCSNEYWLSEMCIWLIFEFGHAFVKILYYVAHVLLIINTMLVKIVSWQNKDAIYWLATSLWLIPKRSHCLPVKPHWNLNYISISIFEYMIMKDY